MVLPSEIRWLQLCQVQHHDWHQGIIKYSLSSQIMASAKLGVLVICCKRFTFCPRCDTMRWRCSVCRSLDHLLPSGSLALLHLPFPPPSTETTSSSHLAHRPEMRISQMYKIHTPVMKMGAGDHSVIQCCLWNGPIAISVICYVLVFCDSYPHPLPYVDSL